MHRCTLACLGGLAVLLLGLGAAPLLAASPHQLFLPLAQKIAASTSSGGPIHTGQGTYYDATGAGNCSFAASPDNLLVAAMNHVDYADSAICGAFVEVTGVQGTVTVRIVDQCPECKAGDIDLSPQAFAQIDAIANGRVPISWRVVSPELSGPIRYQFKDGSNQWWTAIQIRNHRNPIAKLEYRTSAGEWLALSTHYLQLLHR